MNGPEPNQAFGPMIWVKVDDQRPQMDDNEPRFMIIQTTGGIELRECHRFIRFLMYITGLESHFYTGRSSLASEKPG